MKKILTLLVFGAALLIAAPNAQAQNNDVSEISKKEATTLAKEMNLTQEKQDLVFRQIYAYNYNTSMNKKGSADYEANKEKYESSFDEHMKEILSEKQFVTFRKMKADFDRKK